MPPATDELGPEERRDACTIIKLGLAEDVGPGDITTAATVPPEIRAHATIVAREPGVIAGLPVAALVFDTLAPGAVLFEPLCADGTRIERGQPVARLEGRAKVLLTGERLALNLLQRLSGTATLTRRFVDAVAGSGAAIYDTRKTCPGLRRLQKYAVRAGGGRNHRFGLWDAGLIKDNHIAALAHATG
ncbi:MAG: nicotinate-nucleotide diphosphorylase (carboxylating), partial [Planctomycetota bacterium]